MLKNLLCFLVAVVLLTTTSAFAVVIESGSESFDDVAVNANISVLGSMTYNKSNGPVTISGTISNWHGNILPDSTWAGLWSSIGLTPAHYFDLSGTTVTYPHLGDTDYGVDASHQMGFASLNMVFWERKSEMNSKLEGYLSGDTSRATEAAGDSFDFELVYDFGAETLSYTFGSTTTPVVLDISDELAVADTFLLQVFTTNNDSTHLDMGFDVSYEVEASIPAGDANNDGKVDGSDVTILANNWQKGVGTTEEVTWSMGDFNNDGKIDGSDVTILANNWQDGVNASTASVPEPSTVALMLMALASLFIVRRR